MPTHSSFIEYAYEKIAKERLYDLPDGLRGFYTLMKKRRMRVKGKFKTRFKVVYLGISDSHKKGIRQRLKSHKRSWRKSPQWDYFSVFVVKPKVTQQVLMELEAMILHVYRNDFKVNSLNRSRGSNFIRDIRKHLAAKKSNRATA